MSWEKYITNEQFYWPREPYWKIKYDTKMTLQELIDTLDEYLQVEAILGDKNRETKHEPGNVSVNSCIIGRPKFPLKIDFDYFGKDCNKYKEDHDIKVREATHTICGAFALHIDRCRCIGPERLAFDINCGATPENIKKDFACLKSRGVVYIEAESPKKYGTKPLSQILDKYVEWGGRHPWKLEYYNPQVTID